MSGNEQQAALQWLVGRLQDDSGLGAVCADRIYPGAAPDKDAATGLPPAYPLVTYNCQSAIGSKAMGAEIPLVSFLMLVTVWAQNTLVTVATPVRRVFAALHDAPTATVALGGVTYTIQGCEWERDFPLVSDFQDGVRYVQAGAYYRVYVS